MEWRSKYAVLQDLAEVTRGQLPSDIVHSITAGKARPRYRIPVDDEQNEYVKQLMAEDSGPMGQPDLVALRALIQQVKDYEYEQYNLRQDALVITKLNVHAVPFKSKRTGIQKNVDANIQKVQIEPKKVIKKRSHLNVAIMSILAANEPSTSSGKVNLMKPADFIEKTNETMNVSKNIATVKCDKQDEPNLALSSLVYKKKIISPNKEEELIKKPIPTKPSIKSYVPSAYAEEIYKRYLNNAKKSPVKDKNIWTEVEMEMKKLDEKARNDKEKTIELLSALNLKAFEDGIDKNRLASIGLPAHRHQLQKPCAVCRALCTPSDQLVSSESDRGSKSGSGQGSKWPSVQGSKSPSPVQDSKSQVVQDSKSQVVLDFESPNDHDPKSFSDQDFESQIVQDFKSLSVQDFESPSNKSSKSPCVLDFESPNVPHSKSPSLQDSVSRVNCSKNGNVHDLE